jgi:hypothetical protein
VVPCFVLAFADDSIPLIIQHSRRRGALPAQTALEHWRCLEHLLEETGTLFLFQATARAEGHAF